MQTVKDIRKQFGALLEQEAFVGNTVEIIGATFLADEEVILGEVNYDWCNREVAWYKSQSLNVNDIQEPIPTIWKNVATSDGLINSNYGWCIWSNQNGSQYENVLKKLKSDKNSRQGQMIYTRPVMHSDWNRDGRKDFMCTAYNQFFIRDDKLVSHFVMRSNDMWAGYKGDRFWSRYVQQELAKDLDIQVGDLIWTASSLHAYDKQFYLIDNFNKTGNISIKKENYRSIYPSSPYAA